MKKGTLFLIPSPISTEQTMKEVLLPMYLETVTDLKYFVTETPKTARYFLKSLPLKTKLQELNIEELSEHTRDYEIEEILLPLLEGNDMGVISDAGVPSVADPGFRIVRLAQELGACVIPLVGPSSILLALMASGLNGQQFSFQGYLPKEKISKRKRIKFLEKLAESTGQTQIFMEAPYKNQSMLEDILDVCEKDTRLCIALDIMGKNETIKTRKIQDWRKDFPSLEKTPCLFLLNK